MWRLFPDIVHEETDTCSYNDEDNIGGTMIKDSFCPIKNVLPTHSDKATISDNGISNEPKTNAPRYNLRHRKPVPNLLNNLFESPCLHSCEGVKSSTTASECFIPTTSSVTSELNKNDSIMPGSYENSEKLESEKVEETDVRHCLPKFYVENEIQENQQVTYLSPLDEIWHTIKYIHLETSNIYVTEATDLIPYYKSIVHLAFYYKKSRCKYEKVEEKVIKFQTIKRILRTFADEKRANCPIASNKCLKSLRNSNKKTISCALAELLQDLAVKDVATQNIIIPELVTLSFEIERNLFDGFLESLKTTLISKVYSTTWKNTETANVSVITVIIVLSRFCTALCKLANDADSIVNFVHQSLLLLKYRAHPVAYSVMIEWPEVFSGISFKNCLLVKIIFFTLVHHKMKYNYELYKVVEVQGLIGKFYKIKLGSKTAEEFAKDAMLKLDDKFWVDAIVLLCKRQMFPWAYTNVIMKYLLPIVNKWKTEDFNEVTLIKILHALQGVMASCPTDETQNKNYNIHLIVHGLSNILILEKGSRDLKETVAVMLCELGTVRFSACVDVLSSWRSPDGLISSKTVEKMHTIMTKKKCLSDWFCYVAPEKYAIQVKRKGDNFNGKNNEIQKLKQKNIQMEIPQVSTKSSKATKIKKKPKRKRKNKRLSNTSRKWE